MEARGVDAVESTALNLLHETGTTLTPRSEEKKSSILLKTQVKS